MSAAYSVKGLKWGTYLGSPDQQDPVLSWNEKYPSPINMVVSLASGHVFGLGANSCLLVMHSTGKDSGMYK